MKLKPWFYLPFLFFLLPACSVGPTNDSSYPPNAVLETGESSIDVLPSVTLQTSSTPLPTLPPTLNPEEQVNEFPDGKMVAFIRSFFFTDQSDIAYDQNLYILESDRSTLTSVTSDLDGRVSSFEWSPQGSFLIFVLEDAPTERCNSVDGSNESWTGWVWPHCPDYAAGRHDQPGFHGRLMNRSFCLHALRNSIHIAYAC